MLSRLVEAGSRRDHEPTIVSLTSGGAVGNRLASQGYRVVALGATGATSFVRAILQLRGIIRREDPAIIQGWMYHGNVAATLAARGHRVAWNVRCSVLDRHDTASGRSAYEISRRLSTRPDAVVYNSERSRSTHATSGYKPRRSIVIPNGLDVSLFEADRAARARARERLAAQDSDLVVGLLARYHPLKDHATFVAAAQRVLAAQPRALFAMVGRGVDESEELSRAIVRAGLDKRVRLLGDHAPHLVLPGFDVACLSSTSESFPNVLVEAMAASLVPVSTDVGDAAEIVGETGEIVPPRDPSALADALLRVLSLPAPQRAARGVRAKHRVASRYSLVDVAARYDALWREIAEGRSAI